MSPLSRGAKGAYAHVAALADTDEEYRSLVTTELHRLGLTVIEYLDVQAAPAVEAQDEVGPLIDALDSLAPVQYRTFYNYMEDDG